MRPSTSATRSAPSSARRTRRASTASTSLHDTPVLAKLGAGIGRLKVLFTGPLPFADRQANLMGKNEKQTRKLMNDCYRRAHDKEDADETLDVDG